LIEFTTLEEDKKKPSSEDERFPKKEEIDDKLKVFKKALPLLLLVSILLLAIFIIVVLHLILSEECLPIWANNAFSWVKRKFMWNSILRVMLECYLITIISTLTLLNTDMKWNSIEKWINSATAYLCTIYMYVFPIWIYWFLNKMNG
jgi:uncharacterized protein YqhQ